MYRYAKYTRSKKTVSILLTVFFLLSPIDNKVQAATEGDFDTLPQLYRESSGFTSFLEDGSGAFTYEYPIELPQGINGHTPSVVVSYDSHNRLSLGSFGFGWKDNVPYITRSTRKGIDTIYSDPIFTSTLDGELVQTGTTTYSPKLEYGDFHKYTNTATNTWVVSQKNGVTHTFNSLVVNPDDTSEVIAWYLTESSDKNGNIITYTYETNQNQLYPKTIVYGPYTVTFNTASSSHSRISYKSGFPIKTARVVSQITVAKDSSVFKTYDFSYNSDQLTAIDVTTDVAKPTIVFTYSSTSTVPDWERDHDFDQGTDNTHYADVTGNGLPDLIKINEELDSDVKVEIRRNKGDDWGNPLGDSWVLDFLGIDNNPNDVEHSRVMLSTQDQGDDYVATGSLVDVNADGLADIAYRSGSFRIYLNTGSQWLEDTTYGSGVPGSRNTHFADINGDSLPDIIKIHEDDDHDIEVSLHRNTGTGWQEDTTFDNYWFEDILTHYNETNIADLSIFLSSDYGTSARYPNLTLVDMNADGLVDLVARADVNRVFLNTGSKWTLAPEFDHDLDGYMANYMDLNGDGLTDGVVNYSEKDGAHSSIEITKVFLNTGDSMVQSTSYKTLFNSLPGTLRGHGSYSYPGEIINVDYHPEGVQATLSDINGDSLIDYVYTTSDPIKVFVNNTEPKHLLKAITDSSSDTETLIEYQPMWQSGDDNYVPFPLQVVKSVRKTSQAVDSEEAFSFSGGDYYRNENDLYDKYFAGFNVTKKTTDLGIHKTYYHQGNSSTTTAEENIDHHTLIGRPYKSESLDLNEDLYTMNRYSYSTSTTGSSTFIALASELQLDYDGNQDSKAKATTYTYDNTHGSVLTVTEEGEVNGNTDGTWTDVGTDSRTNVYTYVASSSGLVLPETRRLNNDAGTKVSESRFYYDNLSLGSVAAGNLTMQENWVSGTQYIDTEWTYDSYGNVLTEKDGEDNTTSYTYDTYNLYPTTVTNALSQNTQYEYDYRTGKIATTTDPNGSVFVTKYDGFGRPTKEIAPDPQTGNPVIKTEWIYTDTPGSISVQKDSHLTDSIANSSYSYFDGFGNIIQERTEAEEANTFVVRDFIYGDNELLYQESLPYFDSGSVRSNPTNVSDLLTTYTYDALGRASSVVTAVGTTNTSYDQWIETVTDTENNQKDFAYDAFARLVQVTEHNGLNEYETEYTWDTNNNLTKITDAHGNVRNITYDGLSRRMTLEDLHDPADNTYGVWAFAYDDANNLASTTDPNGQTVNYTFDDLNRILTEDYLTQAGVEVNYSYDTCTNGLTRVCQVVNDSATTSYAYTLNGLVASEDRIIASNTYTSSYEYDWLGNRTLTEYPDNSHVYVTYNDANKIEQINQREFGQSSTTLVSDYSYGPHGQRTFTEYGNGLESNVLFDESELYRLRQIITSQAGASSTVSADWYDPNWSQRIQVTVDSYKVNENLTSFPVYLDLSQLPSAFFTDVRSDGGDIRITTADGTTELAREVVSIDTSVQEGELHFLADSISDSTDTTFYLYYGNSTSTDYAVSDTYGRNAVWSDYELVMHLSDVSDSAGNHSPTNYGATIDTGKIGDSYDFSGDRIELGSDTAVLGSNPNVMSVSVWSNSDVKEERTILAAYEKTSGYDDTYPIHLEAQASPERVNGKARVNNTSTNVNASQSWSTNTWYYDVFSFDKADKLRMYRDGAFTAETVSAHTSGDYTDGGTFYLGALKAQGNYTKHWDGAIDEVRVFNFVPTSGWVEAEYNNQSNPGTFFSVSAPEAYATGGPGEELMEIELLLSANSALEENNISENNDGIEEALSEPSVSTPDESFENQLEEIEIVVIPSAEESVSSTLPVLVPTESAASTSIEQDNVPSHVIHSEPETPLLDNVVGSTSVTTPSSTRLLETESPSTPNAESELHASSTATASESDISVFDRVISTLPFGLGDKAQMKIAVEDRATFVTTDKADKQNFQERANTFVMQQVSKLGTDQKTIVELRKAEPQARIQKNQQGVDFTVSYKGLGDDIKSLSEGNLIRWQNADASKEVHAYPLPDSEEIPGGGFEIEVVLTERPEDNSFEFPVEGYEDLSFFYQPPLNEEPDEGEVCTATSCVNSGGEMTRERPENVVGSYAIYTNSDSETVTKPAEKVAHVYRPKISDAAGNEVWGTLAYETGILTVSVPDNFLATAEYPVVVDPTFGYSTQPTTRTTLNDNDYYGSMFTVPTYYGTFDSLTLLCKDDIDFKAVIVDHSNLAIVPNGISNSHRCHPTTGQWHTPVFANDPVLVPGNEYILGVIPRRDSFDLYYDSAPSYIGHRDVSNSYSSPSNLGSASHLSRVYGIYVTYTEAANNAPNAPTDLETENQTNPTDITDTAPEFTAVYQDQDSADVATHYWIQVDNDSDFSNVHWDSGTSSVASTTPGTRTPDISYSGPQLNASTTYYWRIKFMDNRGGVGDWSTSTASFMIVDTLPEPPAAPARIQDISYTYDSVGNIVRIIEASNTSNQATIEYEYDDLYRLVEADTLTAATAQYTHQYSYNPIGNITSKSDSGSYAYAGTSYTNPHAATAINGVTYSYDNNGNLLTTSNGIANTWNYKNQLTQSVVNNATTTYGYDHNGDRVFKTTSEGTTYYPFGNYEVTDTGSTTKHIYMGDQLVATIEGSGAGALTYHNHLDHLGGTSVVTDGIGQVVQELDYYPFGDTRIDNEYGDFRQHIQHTGHQKDDSTGLIYQGARYYQGDIGRFNAQDPVAHTLGDWEKMQENIAVPLSEYLRNPQRLNTYAYAGNNPIKNVDADGKDYYEFSADIAINPVNINAGLKFDPDRMRLDASIGGGPSGGGSANISVAYNPWSDLPSESSYITHEGYVAGGYILGGKGYVENQPFKDGSFSDINLNSGVTIGVGAGIGLSGGVQANWNTTLFDFSQKVNQLKGGLGRLQKLLNRNESADNQSDANESNKERKKEN